MNKEIMFSSKSQEWGTPQDLFYRLDKKFMFDLDPASTHENHLCKNYFTKEEDGLKQDWYGNVYCNPPYGREVVEWVAKAHEEVEKGNVNLVVMLLPARTDTRWFHQYIYKRYEVLFLKGRLKFKGADNSAPFPSMLVLFK